MASAQKVVVLTNADMAKVVTATHHYSEKDQSFKLTLKHRIQGVGPVQVSLMKEQQFEKSPFSLKSTLPATIPSEGAMDLEFGVTYSRSLQTENTISLLVVPVGDTDPRTRGVAVNLKLSADEVLMFFNDRTKQYSKSLPTLEFIGPTEKLIEITWNGGSGRSCTLKLEDSGRDAFKLIPNLPGAAPLANGSEIKLNSGGNPFFIRYDGAAKKGTADVARMTFTEPGGQKLRVDMVGTYQGGNSLFAGAKELLAKDNLIGGFTQPVAVTNPDPKAGIKDPSNTKEPVKGTNPDPKATGPKANPDATNTNPVATTEPKAVTDVASLPKSIPSPRVAAINIPEDEDSELSEMLAKERLQRYFVRHHEENILKASSIRFERKEELFEAMVPVSIDSILKEDPNFTIHPIWVRVIAGNDSLSLPMTNVQFRADSSKLLIKLSDEAADRMDKVDSFKVKVGFESEYLADGIPVYDKGLVYTGSSYGKMYSNSYWAFILWGLLGLVVFLFFFVGFVLAKRPVSSFRYLREARYQRERHKANSERPIVDVETVHIDLARQDTDLIQLAFIDRGDRLDGRTGESIEKVRSVAATVPAPLRGGLVRFFVWLYGPFGRKREPKFKSVYYSLRIELIKGSIPQQLRMKDEGGMIMLGTSLTGNVLATDHQDFKFTKRPFHYNIYLDPAEFLDYTGSMRSVSIPFRVIEEPFEGYVITREFNLNLEIAQRF
ncbi:MAG: hypothetical protein U0176_17170 [Bacteroidia bacterium]